MPEQTGKTNGSNGKPVAKEQPWYMKLVLQTDGTPKPNLANVGIVLQEDSAWQGVLAFNEFTGTLLSIKSPPWPKSQPEWTDEDDSEFASWLQERQVNVQTNIAAEALRLAGKHNSFHPVKDYLERLRWDKTPRVDVWLTAYLGVEHNDYTSAVGAMWLRSAVARIYQPGVKVDHTLILEGPQGIGKSQCLKTISRGWFSDDLQEFGTKDTAMHLPGHWIVELPEISYYTRFKAERLKAFLTRRVDCYKPPYARHVHHYPRQCVFAGTTDRATYLHDEEGNRRFWPVACGKADVRQLRRDRDQLWAEAVSQYKVGMGWWPETDTFVDLAAVEQKARFEYDVWADEIDRFIRERQLTSVAEVLGQIKKNPGDWTDSDQKRVARHLRILGWHRIQRGSKRSRKWIYVRPND